MDFSLITEEITEILAQHGIEIRHESLGGEGGGLCRLKNKTVFFVDSQGSGREQARQCARALREIVDIDSIYLKPVVREFVEEC